MAKIKAFKKIFWSLTPCLIPKVNNPVILDFTVPPNYHYDDF